MLKPHWALQDIQRTLTTTGYNIRAITFQPCHLSLRSTTVPPQEHTIPVLRRGVFFHADKRFCFVAYDDTEQEEAGDTLLHTFIKEPWPGCETRWFYFHGIVAAVSSPSTSAIFSIHRPLGLLFTEPYTLADWLPAYLFREQYTLDPFPPPSTKIFTEPYSWG